jgi:hypothetical protein
MASHPNQHDLQSQNEPQMTLIYHRVDPLLGDVGKDVQLLISIVVVAVSRFLAEKLDNKRYHQYWRRSYGIVSIPDPSQHKLQSQNEYQMTLVYHRVDPLLGDVGKDEQLPIRASPNMSRLRED